MNEVILIKLNDKTLDISLEKITDIEGEYKDKEIVYDINGICIVCRDDSNSTITQYKKLLIRNLLKETIIELNNAHEEVSNLNKRYIGLVNKLIGE